jgi:hypothetical protein
MERKYIIGIILSMAIIIGLIIRAVKEKFNYRSIRPMFTSYDSSHPFVPKPHPDLDYQTTDQTFTDQNKVDCVMRRLFYNGKC